MRENEVWSNSYIIYKYICSIHDPNKYEENTEVLMGAQNVLEFLEGTSDIAVAIRLILATLFGSLIGWERVVKRHSAGIKTFALVSLGSAVAVFQPEL